MARFPRPCRPTAGARSIEAGSWRSAACSPPPSSSSSSSPPRFHRGCSMLALSLAAFAAMYCIGMIKVWRSAGRGRGILHRELLAFACGCLALVVALLSPLDEWSETLFVAHMAQHELLMVVAAPLIALGSPLIAMLWSLSVVARHRLLEVLRRPVIVTGWVALTAPVTVWLLH